MSNFKQIKCNEQVGSANCELFATAYAVNILNGDNVYNLIYNETKMREHLIACFEQRENTFPLLQKKKYRSSPWNKPDIPLD